MVHWNITKENLSLLDSTPPLKAGTVDLSCRDIESAGFERVARFIKEQGALLHTLSIRLAHRPSQQADLADIDFAAACPHMQALDLKGVIINASVFAHPSLKTLKLWEADYRGPRAVTIGEGLSQNDGRALREVSIADCLIPVDTLAVGPAARLKGFQYYLDEDFSEPDVSPDDFIFNACPLLEAITIHVCEVWTIHLRDVLPRLRRIDLDATEYCSYQWQIEDVDDQQRARYRRLLGANDA